MEHSAHRAHYCKRKWDWILWLCCYHGNPPLPFVATLQNRLTLAKITQVEKIVVEQICELTVVFNCFNVNYNSSTLTWEIAKYICLVFFVFFFTWEYLGTALCSVDWKVTDLFHGYILYSLYCFCLILCHLWPMLPCITWQISLVTVSS